MMTRSWNIGVNFRRHLIWSYDIGYPIITLFVHTCSRRIGKLSKFHIISWLFKLRTARILSSMKNPITMSLNWEFSSLWNERRSKWIVPCSRDSIISTLDYRRCIFSDDVVSIISSYRQQEFPEGILSFITTRLSQNVVARLMSQSLNVRFTV